VFGVRGGGGALAAWHPVLAEIAAAWRDRDQLRRRLAANPHARFARGPLADHVRIPAQPLVGLGGGLLAGMVGGFRVGQVRAMA
jgi:hypothetical protein